MFIVCMYVVPPQLCSKAQGDRTLNATKEGRVRRRCYVDSYHKADYSWVRLAARKLGLLVRRLLRRGSRAFSTTTGLYL